MHFRRRCVQNGASGPADVTDILLNRELIAINQDPLGKPANRIVQNGCVDVPPHPPTPHQKVVSVWAGPLAGGAHVVMLLNSESNGAFDFSLNLPIFHALRFEP